jgi:hypothetical protein
MLYKKCKRWKEGATGEQHSGLQFPNFVTSQLRTVKLKLTHIERHQFFL